MDTLKINRRDFLRPAGISTAVLAITGHTIKAAEASKPAQTIIPRWRGFNLLDYFSPRQTPWGGRNSTTEEDFRWMSDWGFDFVRLPMASPRWIDFDSSTPLTPDDMYKIKDSAVESIDKLIGM